MAEPGFLDLMPHTITVAPRGSTRSLYGVHGPAGTAVSYRARVIFGPHWARSQDGRRLAPHATAWVNSTSTLLSDSVFTLPDGTTPPVLAIDRFTDERGTHHTRITFGVIPSNDHSEE